MYKKLLEEQLKEAVRELGFVAPDIVCDISQNPKFGDYTTNIALQLSKQDNKNSYHSPVDLANEILDTLGHPPFIERAEIAGPGFINFYIRDEFLMKNMNIDRVSKVSRVKRADGKKILIEYGHTNPLKEVHIGHLRTFILGESLARILEFSGNEVFRANYQGDIGLHIAKAIWGIQKVGMPKSEDFDHAQKAKFLGQAYAQGNKEYGENSQAKKEIEEINTALYLKDPKYQDLYKLAREWSLEYFEPIYELLSIKYDRCFFESEVHELGKKIVLENVGKVFKEDQGAIIFPGEEYGLHNRVFITAKGNPTYEGKEVGLAQMEYEAFPYDKSLHVVANEQEGYFKVVFKAIELIFKHLEGKKRHLSYGFVDIKEGKMSSRSGNVVTIDDLYKKVSEKVSEQMKGANDVETVKKVSMAAIKFSYLKVSPKPNMVFDIEESIALQGDSGVYLMYSFARTRSLLNRAASNAVETNENRASINTRENKKPLAQEAKIAQEERDILRQIEFFEFFVEKTAKNLAPNELCTYLIELARLFNLYYEKYPIVHSRESIFRLNLTKTVGDTIKTGLGLLGIETVERM